MNSFQAKHPLEFIFRPRSIAVLGASTEATPGQGQGYGFIRALQTFGFPGPIYPVNPKAAGTIAGLPAYPSVGDIPGPVDHAIFSIPAAATLQAVRECAAKGVKSIHFFTAGFSETGVPERAALERELLRVAREVGVRLIGPNCMGLYYPKGGLAWQDNLPKEPGFIGAFSQSGGNATEMADICGARGLGFSKIVSYGNALDINESELLDYFLQDSETRVVAGYIEGVRDGPRFIHLLREAKKPIVLLKGGLTEGGARAVLSHTGSLGGSQAVWDALCQQEGVIQVENLDEMADVLLGLLFLSPLRGRGVGVIGVGGGASVQTADACYRTGLVIPTLPPEVQRELRAFIPEAGTSVRNPVDAPGTMGQRDEFLRALKLIAARPDIDVLLVHFLLSVTFGRGSGNAALETLMEVRREIDKPLVVVLKPAFHPGRTEAVFKLQERLQGAGLPVFYSLDKAAKALAKVIWYHENLEG